MTTVDTIQLDQLDARIRSVWVREQTLHVIGGLLALLRWAVPMFLVLVLIDWLTYSPASIRVLMLLALLGVSLQRAWACGWREVKPFNAVRTALKLESQQGELKSLLVSAIQLRDDKNQGGGSNALRDHTCKLAEQAASTLRPEQAVPYLPLRNPGLLAAIALGLIAVFAGVNGPFFSAGVTRIFAPWVEIEYPTNTQISLPNPELIVKEGDSAEIEVLLSGVIPEQGTISVKTGEGRPRKIDLEITEGRAVYEIASASRDFSYRIKAGDDRTGWHSVRVVPSPRIEAVNVELDYPDYLQREIESVEALTLTVPEGTGIKWNLTLDQPVSAAQFIRAGEAPIDLPISADGKVVTFSEDVSASQGYNFAWVEKDNGFKFTSPRYYLQVSSDQAPRVELTSPETNLVAMTGRPMKLAVRAQDDHGIGSTSIVYRVNQREEATITLDQPIKSGEGEQAIDWDYRKALPDLQVGDTVAFAVVVSDRYPGENGPHVMRSETRRITFLSKEQYLAQIEKQKDRLLSRVQTIYRQQRSAHEAVHTLSPEGTGYTQACQLEAIRQEMVRDQLTEIARQLQALLDDLAANKVSEVAQAQSLEQVRKALLDIGVSHIANAADLLRGKSSADGFTPASTEAAREVNAAARDLASLVLLRGIDSAQEVYAREARMLAKEQADLRWRTATNTSPDKVDELVKHQDELALWTEALIAEIQQGMRYDKRPLAVLRLIRSVKVLDRAGTSSSMREAGSLIKQGKTQQAMDQQIELVRALLNADFSVRLSGAYSTLLKTRDQMALLTLEQKRLRETCAGLPGDEFNAQQSALAKEQKAFRRQLLTLLLPTIPAPRAYLFTPSLPQAPPMQALLAKTDKAMVDALSLLGKGEQDAATAQQQIAEQTLVELTEIVRRWSVEMGLQTQGLGTVVAASSERMSRIEEFEARIIGLLEQTDLAAAEDKKVDGVAEAQLIFSEELAGFAADLAEQNLAEQDPDLPPLLSRLKLAERVANAGVQSLKDNNADDALGYQEQAADALAEALAIVVAQNERLSLLQDLLMFQRSVGFANGYMADIVAEQRDLLIATDAVEQKDVPALLPVFNNLRNCMFEVAPLLDLVAARLDVGTPLAFAQTDFEDAVISLEAGDKLDAIDAQDVAAESLEQVRQRVAAVKTETGYVAEIIDYLHTATSDATMLQYEQAELLAKAIEAEAAQLNMLEPEQAALLAKVSQYSKRLDQATGMEEFSEGAAAMRNVVKQLKAGDEAVTDEMELAATVLADNAESLFIVISMLHGLPSIEVTAQTEPELIRLVNVLALASEQRILSRTTNTPGEDTQGLRDQQAKLAERLKQLAETGEAHPKLTAAHKHLAEAVAAFGSPDKAALVSSQQSADALLRHFIVDQALVLETAVPPPAPQDGDGDSTEGSDSESAVSAGFISDFVSGETPQDKRTEWKVLGERNRAALNQNFARELPLEYRALLKDYYERVAR